MTGYDLEVEKHCRTIQGALDAIVVNQLEMKDKIAGMIEGLPLRDVNEDVGARHVGTNAGLNILLNDTIIDYCFIVGTNI